MNFDIQYIFKLKQIAVIKIRKFSKSIFPWLALQLPGHSAATSSLPTTTLCPLQPYCNPHVKMQDGQNMKRSKLVTEGLREGQGSTRREVGGGIRYACHFFPFITTLLTESRQSQIHTQTCWTCSAPSSTPLACISTSEGFFWPPWPPPPPSKRKTGGLFTQRHSFGLHFDARGEFSTSLTLPCIKTQDEGFIHPPPPLWLVFQHEGGIFDLPWPSLASKHDMGGLLTHHYPFSSRSDVRGVSSTSANPPSHRNTRQGCVFTTTPFRLVFQCEVQAPKTSLS